MIICIRVYKSAKLYFCTKAHYCLANIMKRFKYQMNWYSNNKNNPSAFSPPLTKS